MPVAQKRFPDSECHQAKRESKKPHLCKKFIQRVKLMEKSEKMPPLIKYFIFFITKSGASIGDDIFKLF